MRKLALAALVVLCLFLAPSDLSAKVWTVYTTKYTTPASYADYNFTVINGGAKGVIGTRRKMFQYEAYAQKSDGTGVIQALTLFAPQKHAKGTRFHFVREFEIETGVWKLMLATSEHSKITDISIAFAPGSEKLSAIQVAARHSDRSVCVRSFEAGQFDKIDDETKWDTWSDFGVPSGAKIEDVRASLARKRGSNDGYNVILIARMDDGSIWMRTAKNVKAKDLNAKASYTAWKQFGEPQ